VTVLLRYAGAMYMQAAFTLLGNVISAVCACRVQGCCIILSVCQRPTDLCCTRTLGASVGAATLCEYLPVLQSHGCATTELVVRLCLVASSCFATVLRVIKDLSLWQWLSVLLAVCLSEVVLCGYPPGGHDSLTDLNCVTSAVHSQST
jgi:hypothetical protein